MDKKIHAVADQVLVEGRKITKVFNDFWGRPKVAALTDVDITVPAGMIFGLLGPNGAGKSTLMKLILGHLYPTKGVLSVLGASPRDAEIKRRLGYLPERTAFYASLTARETLQYFGHLLGLPSAESKRRIAQLLPMVGLEKAGERLVGEFSHGMRKRLGLAQALLNDPDLLLLDEPTAGLDPVGCREIKDLILTLGRRGKTILMTSHLLSDVQNVCETIMILYGGVVQAHGSVEDLLAQKDEMQIRAPLVADNVLAEVRRLLEAEDDTAQIEVSYPTRSLEEYFLSVVSEANRRMQATAGVEMGTGVAEYLTEGLDTRTLEAMTKKPAETTETPRAEIDREALQAIEKQQQAESEETPDAHIDRDALAALTKQPNRGRDNER